MRVNVYNEELTNEVEVITATPETGKTFTGVRFLLESAPALHHDADDDDRSAITIWSESSGKLETILETALEELRGQ